MFLFATVGQGPPEATRSSAKVLTGSDAGGSAHDLPSKPRSCPARDRPPGVRLGGTAAAGLGDRRRRLGDVAGDRRVVGPSFAVHGRPAEDGWDRRRLHGGARMAPGPY